MGHFPNGGSDIFGQGPHLIFPRKLPAFYSDVSGLSELTRAAQEKSNAIFPSGEYIFRTPAEIAKGLGLNLDDQRQLEQAARDWVAAPDVISFRKSLYLGLRNFAPRNYELRNEIARRAQSIWKSTRGQSFSRQVGREGQRLIIQKSALYEEDLRKAEGGPVNHKLAAKHHKSEADKHMRLMLGASDPEEKKAHQKAFMDHMIAHNLHQTAAKSAGGEGGPKVSALKKQAAKISRAAHKETAKTPRKPIIRQAPPAPEDEEDADIPIDVEEPESETAVPSAAVSGPRKLTRDEIGKLQEFHQQKIAEHEDKMHEHHALAGNEDKQIGGAHKGAAHYHQRVVAAHQNMAAMLRSGELDNSGEYESKKNKIKGLEDTANKASENAAFVGSVRKPEKREKKELPPDAPVTKEQKRYHQGKISDLKFQFHAIQASLGKPKKNLDELTFKDRTDLNPLERGHLHAILAHDRAINSRNQEEYQVNAANAEDLTEGVTNFTMLMGKPVYGKLEKEDREHAEKIRKHEWAIDSEKSNVANLRNSVYPEAYHMHQNALELHQKALAAHQEARQAILGVNAKQPTHTIEQYQAQAQQAHALSNQAESVGHNAHELGQQTTYDNVNAHQEISKVIGFEHAYHNVSEPPPGFDPIPHSKKGGYHRLMGDHYIYWYPGHGISTQPHVQESPKVHEFHAQVQQARAQGLALPQPPATIKKEGKYEKPKEFEATTAAAQMPSGAAPLGESSAGAGSKPATRGRKRKSQEAQQLATEQQERLKTPLAQRVASEGALDSRPEGMLHESRPAPTKESIVKARQDFAELLPDIPDTARLSNEIKHFPYPAPLKNDKGETVGFISDGADHQVEGAERINAAWAERDGFILQDDAGLGKTVTALMAAVKRGGKRNLIIVPTSGKEGLKRQWGSERNAGLFGINIKTLDEGGIHPTEDGYYMASYDELVEQVYDENGKPLKQEIKVGGKYKWVNVKRYKPEIFEGNKWDTLIFDECHNLVGHGERASAAKELMDKCDKCLYMSATPFTNIADMHYLTKLGLGFTSSYDSFAQWAEIAGANVKGQNVKNPSSLLPMAALAATMHVDGQSLKRAASLDGCHNDFKVIDKESLNPLQRKAFTVADQIMKEAEGAVGETILRALYIGWSKQFWETLKADKAIELGKKALAEGKQVAFFTSFKSSNHEHLRAIPRILYKRAEILGQNEEDEKKVKQAEQYAEIARTCESLLLNLPSGESVVEKLTKAFGGPKQVAEIHGNTNKKPADEQDAYQNGQKKVCVATMARGGTGISLHDTTGEAPRVQINLSLPWSGREYSQVAGRSHRLGSKSETEMHWLLGDDDHERHIANIVGDRLVKAGALTSGDIGQTPSAESLMKYEFAKDSSRRNSDKIEDEIKDIEKGLELSEEQEADDASGADADGQKYEDRKTVSNYFEEFARARKSGRNVLEERHLARQSAKESKADLEARRAMHQIKGALEEWRDIPYHPELGGYIFTKQMAGNDIFNKIFASKLGKFNKNLFAQVVPVEKMPKLAEKLGVHTSKVDVRESGKKLAEAEQATHANFAKAKAALAKKGILIGRSERTVGGQPVILFHGNTVSFGRDFHTAGAKTKYKDFSFDRSNYTWPIPADALEAVTDELMRGSDWKKSMLPLVIPAMPLDNLLSKIRSRFGMRKANNPLELVWCAEEMTDELTRISSPNIWSNESALIKGASHKYIKRVPTGNPAKPWRYWYRLPDGEITTSADLQSGAKFRVAHEGQEGHFQVLAHDPKTNMVHVQHDESGKKLKIKADTLHQMVRDYHAQAKTPQKKTVAAKVVQRPAVDRPWFPTKQQQQMAARAAAPPAARAARAEKPAAAPAAAPSAARAEKPAAAPAAAPSAARAEKPAAAPAAAPLAARAEKPAAAPAAAPPAAEPKPIVPIEGKKLSGQKAVRYHQQKEAQHKQMAKQAGEDPSAQAHLAAAKAHRGAWQSAGNQDPNYDARAAAAAKASQAVGETKKPISAPAAVEPAGKVKFHRAQAEEHRQQAKDEPTNKTAHIEAAKKHEEAAAHHSAVAAHPEDAKLENKANKTSEAAVDASIEAKQGLPKVEEPAEKISDKKLIHEQKKKEHEDKMHEHHALYLKLGSTPAGNAHYEAGQAHMEAANAHADAAFGIGKNYIKTKEEYDARKTKADQLSNKAENFTNRAKEVPKEAKYKTPWSAPKPEEQINHGEKEKYHRGMAEKTKSDDKLDVESKFHEKAANKHRAVLDLPENASDADRRKAIADAKNASAAANEYSQEYGKKEKPAGPIAEKPAEEKPVKRGGPTKEEIRQAERNHRPQVAQHVEAASLHGHAAKMAQGEERQAHQLAAKLHRAAAKAHNWAQEHTGKGSGKQYAPMARKAENSTKLADVASEKAGKISGPGKGVEGVKSVIAEAKKEQDKHLKYFQQHSVNTNNPYGGHYHARAVKAHDLARNAWGSVENNPADPKIRAHAEKMSEKAFKESSLSGVKLPEDVKPKKSEAAPAAAPEAVPAAALAAAPKVTSAKEITNSEKAAQYTDHIKNKIKEYTAEIKRHKAEAKRIAATYGKATYGLDIEHHNTAAEGYQKAKEAIQDEILPALEKKDYYSPAVALAERHVAGAERQGIRADKYHEHSRLSKQHIDKESDARRLKNKDAEKAHHDAAEMHARAAKEINLSKDPSDKEVEWYSKRAHKASAAIAEAEAAAPEAVPAATPAAPEAAATAAALATPEVAAAPAAEAVAPAAAPEAATTDYHDRIRHHENMASAHQLAVHDEKNPNKARDHADARDLHANAAIGYREAQEAADAGGKHPRSGKSHSDIASDAQYEGNKAEKYGARTNIKERLAAPPPQEAPANTDPKLVEAETGRHSEAINRHQEILDDIDKKKIKAAREFEGADWDKVKGIFDEAKDAHLAAINSRQAARDHASAVGINTKYHQLNNGARSASMEAHDLSDRINQKLNKIGSTPQETKPFNPDLLDIGVRDRYNRFKDAIDAHGRMAFHHDQAGEAANYAEGKKAHREAAKLHKEAKLNNQEAMRAIEQTRKENPDFSFKANTSSEKAHNASYDTLQPKASRKVDKEKLNELQMMYQHHNDAAKDHLGASGLAKNPQESELHRKAFSNHDLAKRYYAEARDAVNQGHDPKKLVELAEGAKSKANDYGTAAKIYSAHQKLVDAHTEKAQKHNEYARTVTNLEAHKAHKEAANAHIRAAEAHKETQDQITGNNIWDAKEISEMSGAGMHSRTAHEASLRANSPTAAKEAPPKPVEIKPPVESGINHRQISDALSEEKARHAKAITAAEGIKQRHAHRLAQHAFSAAMRAHDAAEKNKRGKPEIYGEYAKKARELTDHAEKLAQKASSIGPDDWKENNENYRANADEHQKIAKQHEAAAQKENDPNMKRELLRAAAVHRTAHENYLTAHQQRRSERAFSAYDQGYREHKLLAKEHANIAQNHLDRMTELQDDPDAANKVKEHMNAYGQHLAASEAHKIAFKMANHDLRKQAHELSAEAHKSTENAGREDPDSQ